MSEKMLEMIHRIDLRIDQIEDPLLLLLAMGIREGLMDLLQRHAIGLIDEKWAKNCFALLSKSTEEFADREKILLFLKLIGDTDETLLKSINTEDAEKMRELCEIQRNRICFFRMMQPLRNEMIGRLPEVEGNEEERSAVLQEMKLMEQFEALLFLYRKAAAAKQNAYRFNQFEFIQQEEISEKARQAVEGKVHQIQMYQECIKTDREEFEKLFCKQRIKKRTHGYKYCGVTERRAETDVYQRIPTEKEEC